MTDRIDLQERIRHADPYPEYLPLPPAMLADRPDVGDIVGRDPEVGLVPAPGRTRWRGPLVAAAAAVVVLLAGAMLLLARTGPDSTPADQPSDVTISEPPPPEGDAAPEGQGLVVEPAGTGPALVWEEVPAPGNGVVGTVLWGDGRYYLSDYHPEDQDPEFAGSWFVSSDALEWRRVEGSEAFPDEDEIVVVGGDLVRVDFPRVISFDVEAGEIAASRIDLTPLLEVDDACFDPGVIGPEETGVIQQVCNEATPMVAAGGRGALVVVHPQSVPVSEACPPAGSLDQDPDLEQILAGGRVVAEECWSDGYDVHPLAWYSPDGSTWSPVPRTGPFRPGPGARIDDQSIVGIDDGFVLLRQEDQDDRSVEVWFSGDGTQWERLDTPDGFEANTLVGWGDVAIAGFDPWWWGEVASPSVAPLWLISPSGISMLDSEPMPPQQGDGGGGMTAGPAGIVVTYAVEAEDSTEFVGSYDFYLEFSADGVHWSRTTISEDGFIGDFVVGEGAVLRVVDRPREGSGLLVGIPEAG